MSLHQSKKRMFHTYLIKVLIGTRMFYLDYF